MDNRVFQYGAVVAPPSAPAAPSQGYPSNGDPINNIPATQPGDFWFHQVGEELRSLITAAGLAPSTANTAQVLEAVQRLIDAQSGNYALDTGVANAYVVALNPQITTYSDGLTIRFKAVNANTGAATLNAGGGIRALVNDVGAALVGGDISAGSILTATYVAATNNFNINTMVQSQGDARYVGMTSNNINFRNTADTVISYLANLNTAPRTYTFQDRAGTIADLADINAILALGLRGSGFSSYSTTQSLTSADLGRPLFWNSVSSGTLTLPASAGVAVGQTIIAYVNSATGTLNLVRAGADTIFSEILGAVATVQLRGGDSIQLVYGGGGGWVVMSDTRRGIGREQSWVNVTGSRAFNESYTNDTGRPILVKVSFATITGTSVNLVVDSTTLEHFQNDQSGIGLWYAFSAIVPPGVTYSATYTGTLPTSITWTELR